MPPNSPHAPLYNSRIIDTYLRLLQRSYPQVDIPALLDRAGLKPYQTTDPGHWFSQEQIDRFYEKLLESCKNPEIAREAGRYAASSDALGSLRLYLLGFLGPANVLALISKAVPRLTRSASYTSRRLGPRQIEVTVKPYPGVEEKEFQCANRLGWFEAAVHICDQKVEKIEHPQCLFRGDPVCRYFLSWKKSRTGFWKTLRNVSFLGIPPLLAAPLILSPALSPIPLVFGGGLIVSLLALFAEIEERMRLKNQVAQIRKESEETLNRINVNYDNALLTNEIGRAINQETDLKSILQRVVELLSQRLDFDRVMVLLADREQNRLDLHADCGFSARDRALLQDLSIPIDGSHAKVLMAKAFREQKPIIVENPAHLREAFSPEGFRLIKQLEAESFLFCPIVCNGTSLGILAADKRVKQRPLTQTDLSLMEGVAASIGIALRNADLLEGMANQLNQIRKKDEELDNYRENLEEQVKERTIQLQEALQAAETASRAKSEFLANMSHEIRTPLHGVLGLNELLLESGLNPQQIKITQQIQGCAESLLKVITDILDFSKIEANKIDLEEIDFALKDLLRDTLNPFRPQADAKGLDLDLKFSPLVPLPLWIKGDPLRLRQVLNNLVGNAIKFTEEGSVTVFVSLGEKEVRPLLHFEVQDTGIGIAEHQKESIFESFQQADGSTSRRYGGSGLGTTIAKRLVELMGGKIGCESAPGKGSAFWFDIPLKRVAAPATPEQSIGKEVEYDAVRKTGTILVVEDIPVNRDIIRLHLESAGNEVLLAQNGLEALTVVRANRIDLVLMDIQMPQMNGFEATRRIRRGEAGEAQATLPIIAMTANATASCRQACFEAGINDVIVKPVRKRDFLETVQRRLALAEGAPSLAPAAVATTADEPLALDEILKEIGQNRKGLREVLSLFLREAEETLGRLECAHAEGNTSALAQLAHRLKGSSGQFFAWPLYRATEDLEKTASDGSGTTAALARVAQEFQRLQKSWRELEGSID